MEAESWVGRPPQFGRTIYIDMNSFFATVEQQAHPELRGRPVGVCPFVHDSTCVIAASKEAKRFGIKTGTSVREARRLCPEICLMSDTPGLYRDYHHRIMAALDSMRCRVYVRGIDEAMLAVPKDLQRQAETLAGQLRQLIRGVGSELSCSIGISSNLFLAKMGTKLHKPDGITALRLEDLEALYATLGLTDLYGVSWRMARQLEVIGIATPLELYHAPYRLLRHRFGVNGERWYLRLRGYEVDGRPTKRRSVGHQTTLTPDPATTRAHVLSVTSQLCYRVAARLRASGLAATGVQVVLRNTDRTCWARARRMVSPFCDSRSLLDHSQSLLRFWRPGQPVRLISVTATGVLPQQATTTPWLGSALQSERLSRALDQIEQRVGQGAIKPAVQMLTLNVPDRVGFGNAGEPAGRPTFPSPKKVFHGPNL